MNLPTPFASLQTNMRKQTSQGPSMGGAWTGRVAFVHYDGSQRLMFLFDIIPMCGWPPAMDIIGGSTTGGTSAPLRGVVRVRLRQPFVGNLYNSLAPPTGIIVVPEVGSIVSVEMDEAGWVITGFHSGPFVASDNSNGQLAEFSYNPGFEEALPSLTSKTYIPWLFGLSEGDVILGRGDSRIKLRGEGVYIGSGVQCLHLYKSTTGQLFERYVEMERRASGRLSYHRQLPGVYASQMKTSAIQLPTLDALVVNTDIIESSPYYSSNKAYTIRQRGHVTQSTVALGRKAGDVLPGPREVTIETEESNFCAIRETVVQPTVEPKGTSADINELTTTSSVKFDHQVGADGSFHIRAGNALSKPGTSQLGESSQLDFEIAYDAPTHIYSLSLLQSGTVIAGLKFNGLTGDTSINSTGILRIKASQVIIESDTYTEISTKGSLAISSQNANVSTDGTLTMLKEVMTKLGIALSQHQHQYVNVSSPALTTAPIV
jgi:hypothetical protein